MRNILKTIFVIIAILIIIGIFRNFHDVLFNQTINQQFTGNVLNLTGDISITGTGSSIDTGSNDGKEDKTNIELYKEYVSRGNVISFNPPQQPWGQSTTYSDNTSVLNNYLTQNNFYLDIKKYNGLTNGGFLFVRTKFAPKNGIFMYWHNTSGKCGNPVSGKLIESQAYKINNNEFLYPLNEIQIISYYKKNNCIFDWLSEIENKPNQFIGGYVVSFDGNSIAEISLAWK